MKAIPEVRFNGNWLSIKISETIESLSKIGFKVRGVVTDNHSANVTAFNCLLADYGNDFNLYIKHPSCPNVNTYLFYDTVHLLKNVRNNLINNKKFVFSRIQQRNKWIEGAQSFRIYNMG